jgi:hypothetical protein
MAGSTGIRLVSIVCGAIAAAALGWTAYLLADNPFSDRHVALAAEISEINPVEVTFSPPEWDFAGWQEAIAAKPKLWDRLREPPAPPPPPPPKPPDLNKMLSDAGVTVGRQQVGDKARVATKADSRGSFLGVGDQVAGLTIKEVTRTSMTFTMEWRGKTLETTLTRN